MTSTEPLNWREYAIEAALLAAFMCSAAAFATLLQHPSSPVFVGAGEAAVERIPMGIAMGLTAIALIYSPWGARSGAHLNPAVTLTFWRLNKIASRDAVLYVVAQCIGGLAGIVVATVALARLPADPAVNYVATVPGTSGAVVALIAEFVISCGLMLVVLLCSNHPRLAPFTGAAAGALVCAYIVVEAPLSGMSMNPARSLGPAVLAGTIDSMWIYVIGPLAGMLSAAVVHERYAGSSAIACAKLHHPSHIPCIHCGAGARTSRAVHRPEEVPV